MSEPSCCRAVVLSCCRARATATHTEPTEPTWARRYARCKVLISSALVCLLGLCAHRENNSFMPPAELTACSAGGHAALGAFPLARGAPPDAMSPSPRVAATHSPVKSTVQLHSLSVLSHSSTLLLCASSASLCSTNHRYRHPLHSVTPARLQKRMALHSLAPINSQPARRASSLPPCCRTQKPGSDGWTALTASRHFW